MDVHFFICSVCVLVFWFSRCSCLPDDKFAAPLVDRQNAPLVAVLDTKKIATQVVDSLSGPIHRLVNETVQDNIDTIVDKKLSDFVSKFEKKFDSSKKLISLEKEIDAIKTIVAMTSCSNVGTVSKGSIIRFPDSITSYGITSNTLNTFQNTGKFTCETPGLYLISASVMSLSYNACFEIYKDGTVLRRVQISPHSSASKNYHTGTGSVVVMLNTDDTVYVKAIQMTVIHHETGYSCISITKIK